MATFTNQANLTYNGVVLASNITTGELLEALNAAKTAVSPTYRRGDNVAFSVSLVNTDPTEQTGISVSDNLGAYPLPFGGTATPLTYVDGSVRYYVNGVLQPAPTVTAGPPLVFSGITIPVGGNAVIVYEATVNDTAPLAAGSTINNTATVNGAGLVAPITVNAAIPVATAGDLALDKAASPAAVSRGDTLTYTFTVRNGGNEPVTTGAIITDTLNPILNPLTATYNGTPLTAGTDYTYDAATGVFTTAANTVTVPAATYTQDATTGAYTVVPGTGTLVISGTVV